MATISRWHATNPFLAPEFLRAPGRPRRVKRSHIETWLFEMPTLTSWHSYQFTADHSTIASTLQASTLILAHRKIASLGDALCLDLFWALSLSVIRNRYYYPGHLFKGDSRQMFRIHLLPVKLRKPWTILFFCLNYFLDGDCYSLSLSDSRFRDAFDSQSANRWRVPKEQKVMVTGNTWAEASKITSCLVSSFLTNSSITVYQWSFATNSRVGFTNDVGDNLYQSRTIIIQGLHIPIPSVIHWVAFPFMNLDSDDFFYISF